MASLTGTPTRSGTYSFTVTVTDSLGLKTTASYTLTINPPPTLVAAPDGLPAGRVGRHYAQSIGTSGGTPPFSFSVAAGSLPTGTTINADGVISGTPTTPGSYTFTVRAADGSAATAAAGGGALATGSYAIRIEGSPTITSFTPARAVAATPRGRPRTTRVTITGTDFTGATAVRFGSLNATYKVVSNSKIVATLPPRARTGKITVVTPRGKVTSRAAFVVT